MDYRTYQQYTDSYLSAQSQANQAANSNYPVASYENYAPGYNYASGSQYDYNQVGYQSYGNVGSYPPTYASSYNSADPRIKANRSTYSSMDYGPNYEASEYESNFYAENQQTFDLTLKAPEVAIPPKSDDELWVETFLADIGKINMNLESTIEIERADTKRPRKTSLKPAIEIHGAKNALNKCLGLLEQLKKAQVHLDANVETMSSTEWKKKTVEIGLLKDEFSSLMAQFESSENVRGLRQALEKRKKKRRKQKQQRSLRREVLTEKFHNRKVHEKRIDDWLENMKDAVERFKMEENMKKDADCVLAEVTKKKSDTRKHLSLLTSLIKLRSVRETVALQRGEKTSLEDRSVFANITEKLANMWQNALRSYNKEEQGLRMMLEQNAVEDSISARLTKEKKVTQEWELVFFGPKTIPSPAFWGLTSAERDVETFIAIRKSWDTFLTGPNDEGSKIPVGWIVPNLQASENWTKYLQN